MLDAPMQEADRQGVRAVAVLLDDERSVGSGSSAVSVDRGDSATFIPPTVDDLLAAGDNDAALQRLVDFIVHWAASPDTGAEPEPAPGGQEVRPSG